MTPRETTKEDKDTPPGVSNQKETTVSDEWGTAANAVKSLAASQDVAAMSTADLRAWGKDAGLLSKTLWAKVKRELWKQADLDYDALREQESADRARILAESAAAAPVVELFAAGDERGSFAVVGVADTADTAWYGTFHPDDSVYKAGDQTSADSAAAGKAVFLAGKVRESLEVPVVRLLLHIGNELVDGPRLADMAAKKSIVLELDVTMENPATEWCLANGWQAWQAIRLSDLVVPA